jgi:hypothetical protein
MWKGGVRPFDHPGSAIVHYLAEDPWPLAGVLGLVALGLLIALKTTQQGKYLVWALACLALATVVVVVEHLWVTDNERIEGVVRAVGQAVRASDGEAVLGHLTPDVELEIRGTRLRGLLARAAIKNGLGRARFDFLSIGSLEAEAGAESRRGTATFRVYASGSYDHLNFATPTSGTDWSMGLQEVGQRRWKINRITSTRIPWNLEPHAGGLDVR